MTAEYEYRIVLREYADQREFDGLGYIVQTKVRFSTGDRWYDMKKFASAIEAQTYLKRVKELGGETRDTEITY